ncbi:MAG: hypothetical protein ACR2JW_16690 [Thermomicrobiales bacterium]
MVTHAGARAATVAAHGMGLEMASSYWCETCRRVYAPRLIVGGLCPRGHSDVLPVGRFGGMIKGFIASGGIEERSEAQTRHRQLIHALWSQNERDQQFFQLLTPPVSLSKFIKRMDDLHLRGVDEGWIAIVLPQSPFAPTSAYRIEYADPERFVREMYALFDLTPPTDIDERDQASDVIGVGRTANPDG